MIACNHDTQALQAWCALCKSRTAFFAACKFLECPKINFAKSFLRKCSKIFLQIWTQLQITFCFCVAKKSQLFWLAKTQKSNFCKLQKWATATTSKHTLSWHPRAFAMALGHWLNSNAQTCCLTLMHDPVAVFLRLQTQKMTVLQAACCVCWCAVGAWQRKDCTRCTMIVHRVQVKLCYTCTLALAQGNFGAATIDQLLQHLAFANIVPQLPLRAALRASEGRFLFGGTKVLFMWRFNWGFILSVKIILIDIISPPLRSSRG